MPVSKKPSDSKLLLTIKACIANGSRLVAETYDLEFRNPTSTRFYLSMIAQEEFAKAFLLHLVRAGILPFNRLIFRAMNDHACKQLVGMLMDYVIMHWEEMDELEAMIDRDIALGDRFPPEISSALNIFRHEKIGRWESRGWEWEVPQQYDPVALKVADGKKDKHKQDSLYVRVNGDGSIGSTPDLISEAETGEEFERARRYQYFISKMMESEPQSSRYMKTMDALKFLFGGKQALKTPT